MQWYLERAPKNPSEYYGENYQLADNFFKSYYSSKPLSTILILHGSPGTGKTSLINMLVDKYGTESYYSNASDERKKDYMIDVVKQLVSGSKKIVTLDEAENLPKLSVGVLLKNKKSFRHPLVIICNDYYRLDKRLKEVAWDIKFNKPSKTSLTYFLDGFMKRYNINIEYNIKKQIVENSYSYRGVINNLQTYCETELLLRENNSPDTVYEKLHAEQNGQDTNMTLEEMFSWIASNTDQHSIISKVNILIMQSRTGTNVKYAAKHLLRYCNIPEKLRLFYVASQKGEEKLSDIVKKNEIKNEKREKKETKKEINSKSVSDWL